MPLISFPHHNYKEQKRLNNQNTEESSYLDNFNCTKESKNNLLYNMLYNNLAYKDKNDIYIFCISELKNISVIVGANGNKTTATRLLSTTSCSRLHINELLTLFENRNAGLFGHQNINRTAAKYVRVLQDILSSLSICSVNEKFTNHELNNLNIILIESNKWYRNDYKKNVNVSINSNNINIQLGRDNGSMGEYSNLIIPVKLDYSELITALEDEDYSEEVKKIIIECFNKQSMTLNLSNCNLKKIPSKNILNKMPPKLKIIDLSYNIIEEVSLDAFHRFDDLVSLDLSNNNIKQILQGSSPKITKSKYRNLYCNPIEGINPELIK